MYLFASVYFSVFIFARKRSEKENTDHDQTEVKMTIIWHDIRETKILAVKQKIFHFAIIKSQSHKRTITKRAEIQMKHHERSMRDTFISENEGKRETNERKKEVQTFCKHLNRENFA